MKTIYGPLTSWRIGECFNVDPICRTPKVCSFDCVYCKFGSTAFVSIKRSDMIDVEEFSDELANLTSQQKRIPLRFSGSGEPTLARNLGYLVSKARTAGVNNIVVVTNSSLLSRTDVREDLRDVDIVIAKLDAADEHDFQKINRPHPEIIYSKVLAGLRAMRSSFRGGLRLQIMLMEQNRHSLEALGELCQDLSPDITYLSTPTRSSICEPLGRKAMLTAARKFERMGCKVLVEGKYWARSMGPPGER
jgi:wyosine [tRNA(Phe)-imidazoG37] synthetase (radical SAM superfamily)